MRGARRLKQEAQAAAAAKHVLAEQLQEQAALASLANARALQLQTQLDDERA